MKNDFTLGGVMKVNFEDILAQMCSQETVGTQDIHKKPELRDICNQCYFQYWRKCFPK